MINDVGDRYIMKKTIAFINFPASGHVNPQYGLCEELSKKNVKLVYYTAECYTKKFSYIDNIDIRTYPKEFMDYYNELSNDITLQEKMMGLMYVFIAFTERILPFILKDLKEVKPDLIISDSLAIWGKVAARCMKVPYALFFSSFMGDSIIMKKTPAFTLGVIKSAIFDFKYVIKFFQKKRCIDKNYGKTTDSMSKIMQHQGVFTMVSTSKEFHPGGNLYPDNVQFIRSYIYDESRVNVKKDTIFISVGTISFSQTFWDICIEATKNFDYRVAISFGNNKKNSINTESLRKNIVVYNNLSLDEFRKELERSELFITHGGFNSITDGIMAETKLLVCPITIEQRGNGQVLETYGCGKLFKRKKITSKELEAEIKALIDDKEMREQLIYYKNSFKHEQTFADVVNNMNKQFYLF